MNSKIKIIPSKILTTKQCPPTELKGGQFCKLLWFIIGRHCQITFTEKICKTYQEPGEICNEYGH